MKRFESVYTLLGIILSLIAGAAYAAGYPSAEKAPASQVAPDNTAKNQRDAQGASLTAADQSNAKPDIDMTARIRQAVVDDDTLSMNAKNIKIITVNGVVTLRGPVETQAEKDKIVAKAQKIAGTGKVTDQLEVKTN